MRDIIRPLKDLFKKVDEEQRKPPPKFNHRVRKDGESMSDKEKMDKGFNGKTYSINGLEWDF
tara:strand:- start:1560 stop:1745 length:186 start_codon:yes stop_codon:yes gene_type:complete